MDTENKTKECPFCEIVLGKTERKPVYENKDVIVIVPNTPKAEGHVLVIPKKHFVNILDIPADLLNELFIVVQKMSKQAINKDNASGVNILNASGRDAGQSVFHCHIHVIPRHPNDSLWLDIEKRGK
ncbi:MAG TPA: hypothetical protein DDW90_06785 [Cyanobacteria bacterium UBA9971]|nr:hypothetical protein [Cyanobacteria bacterium UBA9971]